MPEGDTVHKLSAAIGESLIGEQLERVELFRRRERDAEGSKVIAVEALGKHLFITLDQAYMLRVHLGMWGSWHRYPRGASWQRPAEQADLLLETAATSLVCFNPKEVEYLPSDGLRDHDIRNHLGPDLLAPSLKLERDWPEIEQRLQQWSEPQRPLLDVLLDQRIACGIGNIYKSELLFISRLAPLKPLAEVSREQLREIYQLARDLLKANLGGGPRVTRFEHGGNLWVYGRRRRPCYRCRTPISTARLGEHHRVTYWCSRCQKISV